MENLTGVAFGWTGRAYGAPTPTPTPTPTPSPSPGPYSSPKPLSPPTAGPYSNPRPIAPRPPVPPGPGYGYTPVKTGTGSGVPVRGPGYGYGYYASGKWRVVSSDRVTGRGYIASKNPSTGQESRIFLGAMSAKPRPRNASLFKGFDPLRDKILVNSNVYELTDGSTAPDPITIRAVDSKYSVKALSKFSKSPDDFVYFRKVGYLAYNANGAASGLGSDGGFIAILSGKPVLAPDVFVQDVRIL